MAPGTQNLTDHTTRARVLSLLRLRSRTVEELAEETGVTANAVRAQLAILGRDGLVQATGVRHRAAAGKPPVLYGATAAAEERFSTAYIPALTAVAETIGELVEPQQLLEIYRAAGRRLAAGIDRPGDGEQSALAKSLLESLGAIAEIDQSENRLVVEGVACPLAATVSRCPESCEIVRSFLAEATGVNVATACEYAPAPRCRFALG